MCGRTRWVTYARVHNIALSAVGAVIPASAKRQLSTNPNVPYRGLRSKIYIALPLICVVVDSDVHHSDGLRD